MSRHKFWKVKRAGYPALFHIQELPKFLGFFSYSYQQIIQTQGLLAHAVKTGDKAEETRLRRGLTELVEKVE